MNDGAPTDRACASARVFGRQLIAAGFTGIDIASAEAPMAFGADAEDAAGFIFAMGPTRYTLPFARDGRGSRGSRPGGDRHPQSHDVVLSSAPRRRIGRVSAVRRRTKAREMCVKRRPHTSTRCFVDTWRAEADENDEERSRT
ncbi:hypothetical protein GCM10010272_16950 [Streptomyces lateritius]|nr:hypothetical protein GCM10010272_16950 [Streptomyces lateritius]